jgi:acyl-CoA hydrolase
VTPRRIDPGELADVLPPDGLTLVSACSAESTILADAVESAGTALGAMTFCGIFVGGLNRRTWRAGPQSRVLTFFLTPELRGEGDRVAFLPLCYQDVLSEIRHRRPQAALFMCSPPDADGLCSFGTEVAFIAELWREIPVRIAHVNPSMPRTPGDPGIPFDALTAYVEAEQALAGIPPAEPDAVARAIAAHVAPFVRNGATVQTGLGKIPDAVLGALHDRRDLEAHTGLMGDGLLDLIEAGVVRHATVGVAIGSARLYASLDHPALKFAPVSTTHGAETLAAIDDLVTINSGIEVDLFGQVYAELTSRGLMSGPGGASDYARGARGHGVRIVALPASAGKGTISRIVAPGAASGPVSLGRMDVDVIATEHGAADLRGLGHEARARALIAIAAPAMRNILSEHWVAYARNL